MERFHITITDKKTGETLVDIDTAAIVGAADEGEGTRNMCFTHCGLVELMATATGALKAADKVTKELPASARAVVEMQRYK